MATSIPTNTPHFPAESGPFARDARRRRIARLRLDPWRFVFERTGLSRRLHALARQRAARALRERGFDKLLTRANPDAISQDPADLMFLYRITRWLRPSRILEFGSGQSTIMFAQALSENGMGHIWSCESEAMWLEHSQKVLPSHLRQFVTLVHSPVVVTDEFETPAWRYSRVPEGTWDLVLIDGPDLRTEGGRASLSCDLVDLILGGRLNQGARGMIDGRVNTVYLARAHTSAEVRYRYSPWLESTLFEVRQ